ncbi:hypothetical protein DL764_000178 [Monosporascus ibericus]|uniref:Uncharacterized protein n=1 Tax=Monosporascus ibericus TaxID=155417 RepID=A0A4Q4TWB6_9PEZI|nr:hypothetical protein DL764_000178 [Monosporascus ibericus]
MAPYTMKIVIQNDTPNEVAYIGSARLSGDGYVSSTGYNVGTQTTGEGASLSKGGGTEGLFIATLFSVSGCPKNLLVWSSMSAASGGEVIVKIAFIDADRSITSLPDACYYNPESLDLKKDKAQAQETVNGHSREF